MKTFQVLVVLFFQAQIVAAQNVADVSKKLQNAVEQLQKDPNCKHSIFSLSVLNSETNEWIYEYNSEIGLAPASCQKVVTSATAFALLGSTYQYKTLFQYNGNIKNGTLYGNLYLIGKGDPTLGSWRFSSTKDSLLIQKWMNALQAAGIKAIEGNIFLDGTALSYQPIPGGWVWDDIGNYYGAGMWGLNWRENQYDMVLQSGDKEGDEVFIIDTKPALANASLKSKLFSGKKGSGDNAYIYLPPYSANGFVEGTIPIGEKHFVISGAVANPIWQLKLSLQSALEKASISYKSIIDQAMLEDVPVAETAFVPLFTHYSPSLDSINYWFMKKSINLYGEALVKTFALENNEAATTTKGVTMVKTFWESKGIESSALHMVDGSGLSPQNRITTKALVQVLQFAKSQPWFSSYYNAFPVYNGMKLKSGTIHGVKSFAGYHTSKAGIPYNIAIIINNFNGSSSEIVQKLFKILDELK